MHRNHLTAHCATAAIAAALALGSTGSLAQDVGEAVSPPPAVQVQPSQPASPPQTTTQPQTVTPSSPTTVTQVPTSPTPVQPITVAPTLETRPAPVMAPVAPTAVPAPAPEASAAPRATTTTRAAPATPARPAAAPVAPDAGTTTDPLGTTVEETAVEPTIIPPNAYPAEPAVTAVETPAPESTDNSLGYLLGALAVLAVPLFAILAILPARRRRAALAKAKASTGTADAPKRTEWPVETAKPVTVAVPATATPMVQPAPITEGPYSNRVATFGAASAPVRGALPSNGAAVPLPARMPEDFAERDALLKRMAAARPDRANPFRHYKSRIKRARLILQSLGRKFENVDPWIDLSEYPNNWPELARRKYLRAA